MTRFTDRDSFRDDYSRYLESNATDVRSARSEIIARSRTVDETRQLAGDRRHLKKVNGGWVEQ